MPAIQIARTDTFENQRQKINQIGNQIFSISQGGSDLATGNLKIGDGTKLLPSLAFTTDASLGFYKPQAQTIGFVSANKSIIEFKDNEVASFQDFLLRKKSLTTELTTITAAGSGYDAGLFSNVSLTGGTGIGAIADITVDSFIGTTQTVGSGFAVGSFTSLLTGGTGSGAEISFDVDGIQGTISQAGSGYAANTYTNVSLTNVSGSGNGATADITVTGSSTVAGNITNGGTGYAGSDGSYVNVALTGGSGNGLLADLTLTGGVVTAVNVVDGGTGYQATDVLGVDNSDLAGEGNSPTGSGFAFTISSITYSGVVTAVTITAEGTGYNFQDVLSANQTDLGNVGGSGFEFSIASNPGIPYNIQFTAKGSGYTVGDILSLSGGITGVNTTLGGTIDVAATVTSSSTTVVLASTTDIVQGMTVSGANNEFPEGTTVVSVDSATDITVSDPSSVTGSTTITFGSTTPFLEIVVPDASNISSGFLVSQSSGTGTLASNTTVTNVDIATNTITLSTQPTRAGAVTLDFNPSYGSPTVNFTHRVDVLGAVSLINISDGGTGYDAGDQLSALSTDLAQIITKTVTTINVETVFPVQTIADTVYSVGDTVSFDLQESGATNTTIREIVTSGGNITALIVDAIGVTDGINFDTTYTTDTGGFAGHRYLIDGAYAPNLTLYVGDIYSFDTTDPSNGTHVFALSAYRDGSFAPSFFGNISTVFDINSANITVASTTGILAGMSVSVTSGSGSISAGATVLQVVDSTTLTLSENPSASGSAVIEIAGVEYTDNVTRDGNNSLTIKVTGTTPNLYFYCQNHPDMGGYDNQEASITIDPNNPKTFGSGLILTATDIVQTNIISSNVKDGTFNAVKSTGVSLDFDDGTVDDFTSLTSKTETLTATTIQSDATSFANKIDLSSGTSVNVVAGNFNVGTTVQVTNSTGDVTTSGTLKSTTKISSNDVLEIIDNSISVVPGQDLVFEIPSSTKQTKFTSTSAIVIPAGDTSQRPLAGDSVNGAIRFNTQTNQYEGYSANSTSWSSLGGVRDLDGNTYILAELTTGANDNTLWFYNDAVNTLKLSTEFLDFRSVKKISSGKSGLPAFTEWAANTAVTIGQYLKHKNNLYEVTGNGTTASSGNAPTHTTGAENNGTAQLTWSAIAVDSLTFEEVSELRIGPSKDCPLIIGQELKLDDNTISTQVQDLVLRPNAGKQTIVDSVTHFRIPAGTDNEKSIAAAGPGSIRFNTTIQQFEGYSGSNWSSLGGVRDVDGNTYIIPETAPAANENILYFYNNNVNTLQLSSTSLDFTGIDNITTSGGNSLALNTEIVTFNSVDTTIDNSDSTTTFISGTKQYLDLGLSSGLNTDPILRLDDQGDVYLNTTFGSGSFNGVKIFDGDLKEFELADYKIKSSTFVLDKGGLESSAVILYPSGTSKGCEVTVVSKSDSGKRSMTKYSVIDNGTDIFHNEYASLNTSDDQYTATFDYTASTEPRITLTLSDDHNVADIINFTVLVQEIK